MEMVSFVEMVRDSVKQQFGNDYQVKLHRVKKNNGVTYTGLCVTGNDSTISPVIYLNDQYRMYEDGKVTFAEVTNYAVDESRKKMPRVDMRYFLRYENIQDRIVYKLINTDRNRELLEDIPHMEFLDLSIVFQCMAVVGDYGMASILIHNVHLKLWDISVEELYRVAEINTPRLMGYVFKSMNEVICEIMENKSPEDFDYNVCMEELKDTVPMYVLGNSHQVEGAACILYPHLLADISHRLESRLYIIPSSIHEVLLLPEDNIDRRTEIRAIIKEINDTQVKEEEILSYSLYYYDAEGGEIKICD